MTTTYNPVQLSSTPLYQIRFYLGDTDSTSWELQDEEINWALEIRGNVWGATAMCALALASKYARLTSISADGVSQNLGQRITSFKLIAAEYEHKECIYVGQPFLYGVSKTSMYETLADSDRVPDIFRLALNDNPPNAGVSPVNEPPLGTGGGFP